MTLLPVVLFPDVTAWNCIYLRAALAARTEPYTDDVVVDAQVPLNAATGEPERPRRLVTVRHDGGPRLDVVREVARIGVNVYADDEADCMDLARMVAALLWSAPDGEPVCKVTQTLGPTVIADETGPHIYMTFEQTVRGRDDDA